MSNQNQSQPGFGRRLWRAFVNLLRLALFLLFVSALGFAAWYGYQELTRSNTRTDTNRRRIELLRSDVDTLMADTSTADAVAELESEVASLETQLERLGTGMTRQQTLLERLQLQAGSLLTRTETASQDIAALQDGLLALQNDVNVNRVMVDELGGNVDELVTTTAGLQEEFARVSEDAGELGQMQQALTLFRVWELVTRAQLHLAQGNGGLAELDIAAARATLQGLSLAPALETDAAGLEQRLQLAQDSLPDDPIAAARDLETAWETLDTLLVALVGGVPADPALLATPTLTATTTITP